MSTETEIWCRNLQSGALLRLAQRYKKQGQLVEALALCIRAVHAPCGFVNKYYHLLYWGTAPLREALGDDLFCQVFRAAFDDPVSREQEISMLNNLEQLRRRPENISFYLSEWSDREWLDPWNDAAIAPLPDPDPEFQQLGQAFLASVRHKLAAGSVSKPSFSEADLYYQEVLGHLHLPPHAYSALDFSSLDRVKRLEGRQEGAALSDKNYYAFYRYLKTVGRHQEPVYAVALSPDGKTVASGSGDNTIKLWDVQTKQQVLTLTGHGDKVLSLAFSPDGQILASGSSDNTIKLWQALTGEELHVLTGHTSSIFSLAFSPDSQIIASGSGDPSIKLWKISSGQELHAFAGHTHSVLSVQFSPDGLLLASGGADGAIKLWDASEKQERYTLDRDYPCVYSICFHPQGDRLVSAHRDRALKVWNLKSREIVRKIPLYTEVVSLTVSPDGRAIAGGGGVFGNVIWIWDFDTGKAITSFGCRRDFADLHSDFVYAVAFGSDRSTLASASRDETVKLWGVPKPIDF